MCFAVRKLYKLNQIYIYYYIYIYIIYEVTNQRVQCLYTSSSKKLVAQRAPELPIFARAATAACHNLHNASESIMHHPGRSKEASSKSRELGLDSTRPYKTPCLAHTLVSIHCQCLEKAFTEVS